MLVVETIAKIRRAHAVEGKSIEQICREERLSRNTVRKVIRSGATGFRYDRATQPRPKIYPWRSELDEPLGENARRPKRERRTSIRIHEELRKAMCRWRNGPVDPLEHDPTRGVHHFPKGKGHMPWTPAQLAFAEQNFAGALRRWYFLRRYTGQQESDVVRLNPSDLDDGGFSLPRKKTGVKSWCPIFPELEAGMATWERHSRLYLLQDDGKSKGKPFSTNQMWKAFDREQAKHPIPAGVVSQGLRANAVIRLRGDGSSALQISDMVGMSVEMIEHACRHADRKAREQAVPRLSQEQTDDKTVKNWK